MWFSPPYFFSEAITIGAANVEKTADWYQNLFGIKRVPKSPDREIWLGTYDAEVCETLVAVVPILCEEDRARVPSRPIVFTKNIKKAHRWFSERVATTEPIQTDSGGNSFFKFRDIEGNEIEVCKEPG